MKIRSNSAMIRLLEERKYDFIKETLILPTRLQSLINAGFSKEQDCIIFNDLKFNPEELLDSEEKKNRIRMFRK